MQTLFQDLGKAAEAAYAETNRSASEFTGIAADLLSDWDLASRLSLQEFFQAAMNGDLTGDGATSKPGMIQLFSGEHVRIVAHLWADAADRLHQHDWTGAFQVIQGQSFNSTFTFDQAQTIDEFALGMLTRTGFSVFHAGSVQPVSEGAELIHSVVYPGKPGLAISLRVPGEGPRGAMEYLRPGLRAPSHRRRGASAAQLDILTQALHVDAEAFDKQFMAMAGRLAPGELLRLLDAVVFDSLDLPGGVREAAVERLPDGDRILASLDDIERSDKTRELLGEAEHPKVRQFICALFHSETRAELTETLMIAGFDRLEMETGRGLATLIVDDDGGEVPPDHVISVLGKIALTGDRAAALQAMRAQAGDAEFLDQHCEFITAAFEAMEEVPVFRCLFKA